MIRKRFDLPLAEIAELCERHGVRELSLFGSALRDDFQPDSDLDFLVTFLDDDTGPWMRKLTALERDLATTLGRPVDVVSRKGIEQSKNWIRKKAILESAEVVYAAKLPSGSRSFSACNVARCRAGA